MSVAPSSTFRHGQRRPCGVLAMKHIYCEARVQQRRPGTCMYGLDNLEDRSDWVGTPADSEIMSPALWGPGAKYDQIQARWATRRRDPFGAPRPPCRAIQLTRLLAPASRNICRRCEACHSLKMPRSNAKRHMNTAHPRVTWTKFPLTLRSPTRPLIPLCNFFQSK